MTDIERYGERLYTQALTDPAVNSLRHDEMAHYIRQEASALCLDWRAVFRAIGSLHPTTVDFRRASEFHEQELEVAQ